MECAEVEPKHRQEEEEALARALAERPDEDMDMANGDDDYPDEAEEVRCRVLLVRRGGRSWSEELAAKGCRQV